MFETAEKQIRWAVVAGITVALGTKRVTGDSVKFCDKVLSYPGLATSDENLWCGVHMKASTAIFPEIRENPKLWELYGVDFSLTWKNGIINSYLFDWNNGAAIHPHRAFYMNLVRNMYGIVAQSLSRNVNETLNTAVPGLEMLIDASTHQWHCGENGRMMGVGA